MSVLPLTGNKFKFYCYHEAYAHVDLHVRKCDRSDSIPSLLKRIHKRIFNFLFKDYSSISMTRVGNDCYTIFWWLSDSPFTDVKWWKMMGRQVFYIANLFYNPNWPLQSKVLQVSDEKTSPNWYLAIIILVSASEKFMESYLFNISLANFIFVPIFWSFREKIPPIPR